MARRYSNCIIVRLFVLTSAFFLKYILLLDTATRIFENLARNRISIIAKNCISITSIKELLYIIINILQSVTRVTLYYYKHITIHNKGFSI
jgi:hypothetical protein